MKFKNIIISAGLLISFVACERKLDLLPQQELDENIVFDNPASTYAALLGVYSTTQTLDFYGSLPQVIAEYMGDNVEFIGTFPTLQDLNTFSAVSTNSNVATIWRMHYQVITRANKIIANVPNVEGLEDGLKAQYIAEAKFLSALAHFQLVNLFAQPFQVENGENLGVPIVLEEFTSEVTFPSRSTLNEVHAQVKQDLEEAIPDLLVEFDAASD